MYDSYRAKQCKVGFTLQQQLVNISPSHLVGWLKAPAAGHTDDLARKPQTISDGVCPSPRNGKLALHQSCCVFTGGSVHGVGSKQDCFAGHLI